MRGAPGAVPILAVHSESVVECGEKDVEKAEARPEKAMIDRMDEVVNGRWPTVLLCL